MIRQSEKNLDIINNFILHITRCDNNEDEPHFKTQLTLTPKIIYDMAKDYVKECLES